MSKNTYESTSQKSCACFGPEFSQKECKPWPVLFLDRLEANLDNLREGKTIDLGSIFADESIAQKWETDHAAIKDLYGNEDALGGVNPGDRQALYYLMMHFAPKLVLEVGTHIDASTLHIAAALKQLNTKGTVSSVDITDVNHPQEGAWKKVGISACPADFASRLSLSEYIEFNTSPCLDFMRNTKERYDFIFLDGGHTAASVYKEVHAALSLLNKNGVILLHDYYPGGQALFPDGNIISGPFPAMERIRQDTPSLRVLPLDELPWETKQGSRKTSLALVIKD